MQQLIFEHVEVILSSSTILNYYFGTVEVFHVYHCDSFQARQEICFCNLNLFYFTLWPDFN